MKLEEKVTELWIVIDEQTLNTMKGKNNKTAKFRTLEEADWAAAKKLEIWDCKKIHFTHKWIQHTV